MTFCEVILPLLYQRRPPPVPYDSFPQTTTVKLNSYTHHLHKDGLSFNNRFRYLGPPSSSTSSNISRERREEALVTKGFIRGPQDYKKGTLLRNVIMLFLRLRG